MVAAADAFLPNRVGAGALSPPPPSPNGVVVAESPPKPDAAPPKPPNLPGTCGQLLSPQLRDLLPPRESLGLFGFWNV